MELSSIHSRFRDILRLKGLFSIITGVLFLALILFQNWLSYIIYSNSTTGYVHRDILVGFYCGLGLYVTILIFVADHIIKALRRLVGANCRISGSRGETEQIQNNLSFKERKYIITQLWTNTIIGLAGLIALSKYRADTLIILLGLIGLLVMVFIPLPRYEKSSCIDVIENDAKIKIYLKNDTPIKDTFILSNYLFRVLDNNDIYLNHYKNKASEYKFKYTDIERIEVENSDTIYTLKLNQLNKWEHTKSYKG